MTQEDAVEISGWRYPPPYDFYDATADAGDLAELLDPELRAGNYLAAVGGGGGVVGFAQLVADGGTVDVGLGLRPDGQVTDRARLAAPAYDRAMIYDDEPATARDRLPAVLGMASVALLAAALRWAHHWGALADLIDTGRAGGRRCSGWRWPASRSRPWWLPASPLPRVRIRPAPAGVVERDPQG